MGSGDIALPSLEMLLARYEMVGVVTQPDRPVGRHATLQAPPVKELALSAGVPVLQPELLRDQRASESILSWNADVLVVMAYGQILPRPLLEGPRLGCINVHASLLPRHRGASCIQAAIVAGDRESGVTVMHMARGLDTGDVIRQEAVALAPGETGGSLHDRLAELSPALLDRCLQELAAGTAPRMPQDDAMATYAPKLERVDGQLDWSLPADELERRVRAHEPWPGSFTCFRDGRGRVRRLKVFPPTSVGAGQGSPGDVVGVRADTIEVATGDGVLGLQELQAEGGRRLGVREFLAGHPVEVGDAFFSLEKGGV